MEMANDKLPSINFKQLELKCYDVHEINYDVHEINYISHLLDEIMEKWRENEGKLKIVFTFTYKGKEIQRFEIL